MEVTHAGAPLSCPELSGRASVLRFKQTRQNLKVRAENCPRRKIATHTESAPSASLPGPQPGAPRSQGAPSPSSPPSRGGGGAGGARSVGRGRMGAPENETPHQTPEPSLCRPGPQFPQAPGRLRAPRGRPLLCKLLRQWPAAVRLFARWWFFFWGVVGREGPALPFRLRPRPAPPPPERLLSELPGGGKLASLHRARSPATRRRGGQRGGKGRALGAGEGGGRVRPRRGWARAGGGGRARTAGRRGRGLPGRAGGGAGGGRAPGGAGLGARAGRAGGRRALRRSLRPSRAPRPSFSPAPPRSERAWARRGRGRAARAAGARAAQVVYIVGRLLQQLAAPRPPRAAAAVAAAASPAAWAWPAAPGAAARSPQTWTPNISCRSVRIVAAAGRVPGARARPAPAWPCAPGRPARS